MKPKLPKVLSMAVLAALGCASVYAELNTADNIDYTLTANGDGTYNSKVVIGDGVNTTFAGGVYVQQTDGNFDNTQLRDVTIEMTGGKVTDTLAAGVFRGNPVDGKVQMDITGGSIGTLAGGNHLNTAFNGSYIDSASLESITLNVGGNATISTLRGGSIVGVDGGYPNESYFQQYTTTGAININIKDNATITTMHGAAGPDLVNGALSVNVEGGSVTSMYVNNGGSISEDVRINVSNGNVTYLYDVLDGSVQGNVANTITGGNVYLLITSYGGTVEKNSSTVVSGGQVDYIYGVYGGTIKGDSSITVNGGKLNTIYGTLGGSVGGDSSVTINEGSVKDVNGTYGGTVKGDVAVTVNGGTVSGTTTGCATGTVNGNVEVTVNGGNLCNVYAANGGQVAGNTSVHLKGGQVTGNVYGGDANLIGGTRTLYVGTEEQVHKATVAYAYGFDEIIVAKGSSLQIQSTQWNVFDIKEHSYTLTASNLSEAATVTNGSAYLWDADVVTLNLRAGEKLKSGRYLLIDATNATLMTDNWLEEKVIVKGEGIKASFSDLAWVDNQLVFIYRGADAESALVSNWGVFKSSQAFVSTLWGGRLNSVVISDNATTKDSNTPVGYTVAWGNVYGQSSRIGGVGADYSIFGGAIGVERCFASLRTLGAAIGYDWGSVSPFKGAEVDQETAHFALYGRSVAQQVGANGHIFLDWSAAVGNTTSDTATINGKWEQKHLQLDARVSYQHRMNDKVLASVFAGLQYFAAEDDAVGDTHISSMQNLRTEAGVGLSYRVSDKVAVYGEASIYNDAMRHNPSTAINGIRFSGTNPGRLGGNLSAGVTYELNEYWSLHGNYSFNMADDNREHNVNFGVSYEF